MEKRYNSITICRDHYQSEEEMWAAITSLLKTLTKENMDIQFYCDEQGLGIYCIHYNSREFGEYELDWVGEDEYIVRYTEDESNESEEDN